MSTRGLCLSLSECGRRCCHAPNPAVVRLTAPSVCREHTLELLLVAFIAEEALLAGADSGGTASHPVSAGAAPDSRAARLTESYIAQLGQWSGQAEPSQSSAQLGPCGTERLLRKLLRAAQEALQMQHSR